MSGICRSTDDKPIKGSNPKFDTYPQNSIDKNELNFGDLPLSILELSNSH